MGCSARPSRGRYDDGSLHHRRAQLAFIVVAAIGPWLPPWLVSLATIAFANALVVLGLIVLWRAGLVPFGQALFYAIGAYAVALIGRYTPIRDVFVVVLAGAVCAGLVAYADRLPAGALSRDLLRDAEPRACR